MRGGKLDRDESFGLPSFLFFRGDSAFCGCAVWDGFRLYHDRSIHSAGGGNAFYGKSVLAQLYPLAWRHGCSGVRAGDWQRTGEERRLHDASSAGGEPWPQGGKTGAKDEGYGENPVFYLCLSDDYQRVFSVTRKDAPVWCGLYRVRNGGHRRFRHQERQHSRVQPLSAECLHRVYDAVWRELQLLLSAGDPPGKKCI